MTTQQDEQHSVERAELIAYYSDRFRKFGDIHDKQAAALLAADGQAGGEAVALHEKVKWGAQTYGPLLRAAIDLLAAVDARHEETGTLKYTIPYGAVNALRDAVTANHQPQAVAQEIEQLIRERDDRDEIIDRLCDAVLGEDRHEWSSAYGFDDAVADVEERINQLHQPSVDRAWTRFEQAHSQQAIQVAQPLTKNCDHED